MRLLLPLLLILSCSSARVAQRQMKSDIATRIFDLFEQQTEELSDRQIANVADQKALLPKPFNVAVYFQLPGKKEQWRWTAGDKQKFLTTLKGSHPYLGRAFELINTSGPEEELKKLRMMAAQQGADALLILQGVSEVKAPANGLAATYMALLPMLFVNGNTVSSVFAGQAVLWDVRTSNVHLAIQTEGDWQMKRPLLFQQRNRALEKAKDESLEQLEGIISQEMRQLKLTSGELPRKKGLLEQYL